MNDYSILSKAISEVFESQLDEFMNSVDCDCEVEFSEKFERKMSKLIKRRKKPYFKLICTGGRRAACIIIAIIILSVSSLSVGAVREAVHDFIMNIFGNHTTVSVNGNSEGDYPTTIEEEYEISNLPDGFELADYSRDNGTLFAAYFNGDQYILFEQIVHCAYTENLDNEHSAIEYYTDESNQEYLIQSNDQEFCVEWNNGDYILKITSNLNKNDVISLCRSTKVK